MDFQYSKLYLLFVHKHAVRLTRNESRISLPTYSVLRFDAEQEARGKGSDANDAGAAVAVVLHREAVQIAVRQAYEPPDDGETQPAEQKV